MSEAENTTQATPAETESVIRVENVGKDFEGRTVLDDIDMDIYPGETAVIMGGSGCGKSTLLRIMVGAYQPTRGRGFLFGQDLTELSEKEMVWQ